MNHELKPYPAYRDSGLTWVGTMPSHWSIKRGKALFSESRLPVREGDEIITCFRDGQVTLRKNRRTSGFMIALFEAGYQGVRKGHLVIHAMDAFAGAVGVSDSDGKCTPEYIVADPRSGDAEPSYFAQLIRYAAHQGYILVSCPAVRERAPRFRYTHFGDMQMPVPPPEEQVVIVRFLDHANRRIEKAIRAKRKLIALLNEQKQVIIHQAVTRGLDPNVPMKNSGIPWLGDIPAHWKAPLNQRVFREKTRHHGNIPEIQLSLSQRDGLIPTKDMQERSLQTSSFENWKVVLPGDLVVNRFKAHLGVFFKSDLRGIVSFHYGVFSPISNIETKYFEYLFHTKPYKTIYAGRSNGMTVGLQNLSNQNFYSVRCILPPFEEQLDFVSYINVESQAFDNVISRTEREIELLREYRTRLIADVVTGKLDVREAAAGLPDSEEPAESLEEVTDLEEELDDIEGEGEE